MADSGKAVAAFLIHRRYMRCIFGDVSKWVTQTESGRQNNIETSDASRTNLFD